MKKIILFFWTGILAMSVLSIPSCIKKANDVPEDLTGYDPDIPVTHTIAQLVNMPQLRVLHQDIVVSGIVAMDDRSGNYYKKLVVQDETGGIEINLDQNNIYNDYPVGRKVYILCKGLTLGNNGGTPQLGYGLDERNNIQPIPFLRSEDFLVKANYPVPVRIDTFDFDELYDAAENTAKLNRLVAIRNVEFSEGGSGYTFALANSTTNRRLRGCEAINKGSGLVVRTSNYARFQGEELPGGTGVITGLYTKFGNTAQIILRDLDDVRLGGPECNVDVPSTTITALRSMYNGSFLPLSDLMVSGVVISDRANKNVHSRNLLVQQGSSGIVVRFTADHTFNLGDSVDILLDGSALEQYQGTLQVNNVQISNASRKGTGMIMPIPVTVADLNTNFDNYESTLVMISNVSFPAGNFSGSRMITDGSGSSIILYTAAGALFASQTMPQTASDLVAIAGRFGSTTQLQIRNMNDIQ